MDLLTLQVQIPWTNSAKRRANHDDCNFSIGFCRRSIQRESSNIERNMLWLMAVNESNKIVGRLQMKQKFTRSHRRFADQLWRNLRINQHECIWKWTEAIYFVTIVFYFSYKPEKRRNIRENYLHGSRINTPKRFFLSKAVATEDEKILLSIFH